MSNALQSGVTGLKCHQTMIDVAGNNLANMNTTAFKSSRVTFTTVLSETLREASGSTDLLGGTNPMQIGSGVGIGSVDRNDVQGSLVDTGNPLDMAIEGAGFFVLSDGQKDVYTRVGQFSVDSAFYMVDPRTGNRVQRIGSEGVEEGFQSASNNDIRIPYDTAMPASETAAITYTGNLPAAAIAPTTNILSSGLQYTQNSTVVNDAAHLDTLDQTTGMNAGDVMTLTGTRRDGSAVNVNVSLHDAVDYLTVSEFLDEITAAFANPADATDEWSVATIENGEIMLTDAEAGYSKTDMMMTYVPGGAGTFTVPTYFEIIPGGETAEDTNIPVYDSQGIRHILSATLVRHSDAANKWDMVLGSISGDGIVLSDRRVEGITFLPDGSYGGMDPVIGDTEAFSLYYASDPTNLRTLHLDLGTIGRHDGITQFGGGSTVTASEQDGYGGGWLSDLSIGSDGVLIGVFSNGVRRDLAALKLATFQNPSGLKDIGNGYFSPSANSGEPIDKKASEGGAGIIHGGKAERSNVDVANEFVSLIQAQNGFQANAKTIRVVDEMLRELSQLIR